MNLVEKEVKLGKEKFILTNQRALIWPNHYALILSDLHLGKTAHFRKHGIALPSTIIEEDLERLSRLILHYSVRQLIIVGDFLHAGQNSEFQLFQNWKSKFHDLKIVLIKGNHDRVPTELLADLGIDEVHSLLQQDDFLFSHEHLSSDANYVISGHIHPGVSIKTSIRKNIKLPCYIVDEKQLILPAFSSFTGLDTKDYFPYAKKYVFDHDFLMEL